MTKVFTFRRARPRTLRTPRWAIALSAALIALAAPTLACEKSAPRWTAASEDAQSVAIFTGEFVNGMPVYRMPSITVVTRREAEIARTQRDDAHARPGRPRPNPRAAAPAPAGKLARASQETIRVMRCLG